MKPDRRFERSYDKDESSRNRWPFSRELDEEDDILLKKRKDSSKDTEKKTGEKEEPKTEKETASNKKVEEEKKAELEKKDKRTEIIERSQAFKKQYEDEPAPKDPETLARLIVAERIVTLDKQLQHPDKEAVHTPEELEETLDYMCLLAEKLEDPQVESLPEVEEIYEELIELTEAALEKGEDPNELILDIDEQLQYLLEPNVEEAKIPGSENPQTIPAEAVQTNALKGAKAAAIVALFTKFMQPRPEQSTEKVPPLQPHDIPQPYLSGRPETHLTSSKYEEMPGGDYKPFSPSPSEQPHRAEIEALYRPPAHSASEYHVTTSGRNHIHPLASIAIASVIATRLHKGPEASVVHSRLEVDRPELAITTDPKRQFEMPKPAPTPQREVAPLPQEEATPFISYSEQRPQAATPHIRMAPERPSEIVSNPHDIVRREADRKLEHMTTQSLLVLAHGVHLGYGQYLKEEFEKGTINKEGLIKVLKARAKGKDFSREYREQAAHYRLLKSSPEFLHEDRLRMALPPVTPNDGAPIQDISSPLPPHVNSVKDVSPTQPLAAAIPRSATTTDEPHNENDAKKSDANNLWIIAIIIGVIILSLLLWTLFK